MNDQLPAARSSGGAASSAPIAFSADSQPHSAKAEPIAGTEGDAACGGSGSVTPACSKHTHSVRSAKAEAQQLASALSARLSCVEVTVAEMSTAEPVPPAAATTSECECECRRRVSRPSRSSSY